MRRLAPTSADDAVVRRSFGRCVAAFRPFVVRTALRVLNSRDDAEDVAQAVFARLWEHRTRYELEGLGPAFFGRAARNEALHTLSRRDRRRRLGDVVRSQPPAWVPAGRDERLDPVVQAALANALASLAPRARQAFVLRWEHGLTNREVGRRLGIGTKAAEKLLARARQRLRPFAAQLRLDSLR
jgi:RNA polymerase sigma-70 factor (ECF subfamily)